MVYYKIMNPYEILNVTPESTDQEIKKSYRKLAAKHHPDKGGNEEEFKKINEAYSQIENQQKRSEYQASQNPNPFGFGDMNDMFGDIFGDFFGNSTQRRKQKKEQTDDDIMFDLRISLAQLKKGARQRVVFNRTKKCTPCDGVGGQGKQNCATCSGTGVQTMRIGPMIQQMTCQACGGQGVYFQKVCDVCSGVGSTQVRESVDFVIKSE